MSNEKLNDTNSQNENEFEKKKEFEKTIKKRKEYIIKQ